MGYNATLDQCAEVLAKGDHPRDVVWAKLFAAACRGELDGNMFLLGLFHEREEPFTGARLVEAFRTYGDVPPIGASGGHHQSLHPSHVGGESDRPIAEMVASYRPYWSRGTRNVIGRVLVDMESARAWWARLQAGAAVRVPETEPGEVREFIKKAILREHASGRKAGKYKHNKSASEDLHLWAQKTHPGFKVQRAATIRKWLSHPQ